MSFDAEKHLSTIGYGKNAKEYLEVKWRLVWFREKCPKGTIETRLIQLELDSETMEEKSVWNDQTKRMEKRVTEASGWVLFRAYVSDGEGRSATGYKSEKAASFPDFIEKAETGAVGRALAMLGFGTQFTGTEFDEEHRIVDAPVER